MLKRMSEALEIRKTVPDSFHESDIPVDQHIPYIELTDWIEDIVGGRMASPSDPKALIATYRLEDGVYQLEVITPVSEADIQEGYHEIVVENQTVNACASTYEEGALFTIRSNGEVHFGILKYVPEEGLLIEVRQK